MTFITFNDDDSEYVENEFDNKWFDYIWKYNICLIVYQMISSYCNYTNNNILNNTQTN